MRSALARDQDPRVSRRVRRGAVRVRGADRPRPPSSQRRTPPSSKTVDASRAQVEQVAVNRFVASGSAGIPILTGYRQPSDQLQADVLVNVVTESSADAMDAYAGRPGASWRPTRRQWPPTRPSWPASPGGVPSAAAAGRGRGRPPGGGRGAAVAGRAGADRGRRAQRQAEERQRQAEAPSSGRATAPARRGLAVVQAVASASSSSGGSVKVFVDDPFLLGAAPTPDGDEQTDESHRAERRWWQRWWRRRRHHLPGPGLDVVRLTRMWAHRSGGRSHQGVDLIAGYRHPAGPPSCRAACSSSRTTWGATPCGSFLVRTATATTTPTSAASRARAVGCPQGEVIGYVGSTGNSSVAAPPLRGASGWGDPAVNPYPWVRNAGC